MSFYTLFVCVIGRTRERQSRVVWAVVITNLVKGNFLWLFGSGTTTLCRKHLERLHNRPFPPTFAI